MATRMEHANLCVRDIDEAIRFLQAALPDFRIRHDGVDADGARWVHIGTEDTYVALTRANQENATPWIPYAGRPGVNHLAFEVDDADALSARMQKAGYRNSTPPNNHPHRKRVYYHDSDGNDWEFVEYLSSNPSERNDYEIDDKQEASGP